MRAILSILLVGTALVAGNNLLAPATVELGRKLFHDRRLSRDNSISCATCHDPTHGFAEDRALSRGIGNATGARNAPALINRADGTSFFWDGRAGTLEDQVLQPITNPEEMGMSERDLVPRLERSGYGPQFRAIFGRSIAPADIARALASYIRAIRSENSAYDRYLHGEVGALTPDQQTGYELFTSRANCWMCHTGDNFTDEQFHNTGVGWNGAGPADQGRFRVTHKPDERGAFKTPTLREIARTAPYMHDGSVATLDDVVDYYDRGGNKNPCLDPAIKPLHLTPQQKRALVAFLHALTGAVRDTP